jgi:hypothetical protein
MFSRSPWDGLHPSSLNLHRQPEFAEIIAHYQWKLFEALRKDLTDRFDLVYEELDALCTEVKHTKASTVSHVNDVIACTRRVEASVNSHLDSLASNDARLTSLSNKIQTSMQKGIDSISDKINCLANYCQEQSYAVVARLPPLKGNNGQNNEATGSETTTLSNVEDMKNSIHSLLMITTTTKTPPTMYSRVFPMTIPIQLIHMRLLSLKI